MRRTARSQKLHLIPCIVSANSKGSIFFQRISLNVFGFVYFFLYVRRISYFFQDLQTLQIYKCTNLTALSF